MIKGLIFDIKRFAVHDGNGIRTTVFFKGCPLKCLWCHNPEGISFKQQLAFYVNKCINCGECLCQPDFCAALLKTAKENGLNTAVDTCGFVPRAAIEKVMPFTDMFLYDIKAIEESVHIKCTGQSNRLILENLKYIDAAGKKTEIRYPYVPGCNSGEAESIADFVGGLKNVTGVRVLPYHNYAGSKYLSLGMKNTLPGKLPDGEEIKSIEGLFAAAATASADGRY